MKSQTETGTRENSVKIFKPNHEDLYRTDTQKKRSVYEIKEAIKTGKPLFYCERAPGEIDKFHPPKILVDFDHWKGYKIEKPLAVVFSSPEKIFPKGIKNLSDLMKSEYGFDYPELENAPVETIFPDAATEAKWFEKLQKTGIFRASAAKKKLMEQDGMSQADAERVLLEVCEEWRDGKDANQSLIDHGFTPPDKYLGDFIVYN